MKSIDVIRPVIGIPGRFSAHASAIRFAAVVVARRLLDAVTAAGGQPVMLHPSALGAFGTDTLSFLDGIVLPGGGDLSPARYGASAQTEELYDIDDEQDEQDLALARWAESARRPVLAICRGFQVANVARGGTLEQHMSVPHRPLVHQARPEPCFPLPLDGPLHVSCSHHQRVDRLGDGLQVAAWAEDGTVEAVVSTAEGPWFFGVQWHPEDDYEVNPLQARIFAAFVDAARERAALKL